MARSLGVVRCGTWCWAALCAAVLLLTLGPVCAASGDGVRIRSGGEADAVRLAVKAARDRLARPGCRRIFSEFHDARGRPLQERLDSVGQTPEGYLAWIVFVDGQDARACARRAFAVTEPGSRVVRICTKQFIQAQRLDPARVEITIIHEMLHSLGLGENPPSPSAINDLVSRHCMPPA